MTNRRTKAGLESSSESEAVSLWPFVHNFGAWFRRAIERMGKSRLLAGFLTFVIVGVPVAAHALTFDGRTMNFTYSGSISSTDCLDPPRGTGYRGDVFRVVANGTISIYMMEGNPNLSDPFLVVRASNRIDERYANDDAGDDDNGDGRSYSAFLKDIAVATDEYIIATTYGAGAEGNYTLYSSAQLQQVTSCPQIITTNIPSSAVYGETKTFTATATSTLDVSISTSTPAVCSITDGVAPTFSVQMIATGTCTITHSQAGDGSNAPAPDVVKNITVNPKNLTLSGLSADKVYDRTTTATVTGTPALSATIVGDDVSLAGAVSSGTFNSASAGTRTVTVTGLSLGGADAAKYSLTATFSAVISKLAITGEFANVPTKVYNGNTSITLEASNFSLTGVIDGDTVTVSNTSGVLDAAGVGDRTVTVATPTLGGAQGANYSITGPLSGSATVSAKPLTLGGTFSAANKTFDGTTAATISSQSLTLTGVVAGETEVAIDSVAAAFASSAIADNVVVSITSASLTGSQSGNYSVNLAGAPTTLANITAGPPDSPTTVTAVANGPTAAVVSWVAPVNNNGAAVVGYKVEASADNGTNWTTNIADTGSTSVTANVTGLNLGGRYLFRVSAINSVGTSSPTATAQILSLATPPGLSFDLRVNFDRFGGARISWSAPTDNGGSPITGYVVQYQKGGTWIDVAPSGTSAAISGVYSTQQWSFRVAAVNAVGQGSFTVFSFEPAPDYSGPQLGGGVSTREVQAGSTEPFTLLGSKLDKVTRVLVDGKEAKVLSKSDGSIVISLPELTPGSKNIVLYFEGGASITHQDALRVVGASEPKAQITEKVNAGSFKGYVALYAKGYAGQRMSAKVGNDWVVVASLASNFERVVEFTGAGYTISVPIYINRVLVDTITVTTK